MQKQQAAGRERIDLGPGRGEAGLDVVQHVVQLHRDAGERGQQREDGLLAEAVVYLDRQVLQQLDHLADVLDRVERADGADLDGRERGQPVQLALVHARQMVAAHRHVERFVLRPVAVGLRLQGEVFHTDRKIAATERAQMLVSGNVVVGVLQHGAARGKWVRIPNAIVCSCVRDSV